MLLEVDERDKKILDNQIRGEITDLYYKLSLILEVMEEVGKNNDSKAKIERDFIKKSMLEIVQKILVPYKKEIPIERLSALLEKLSPVIKNNNTSDNFYANMHYAKIRNHTKKLTRVKLLNNHYDKDQTFIYSYKLMHTY